MAHSAVVAGLSRRMWDIVDLMIQHQAGFRQPLAAQFRLAMTTTKLIIRASADPRTRPAGPSRGDGRTTSPGNRGHHQY